MSPDPSLTVEVERLSVALRHEATAHRAVRSALAAVLVGLDRCDVAVHGGQVDDGEEWWCAEGVAADEDARCALGDAMRAGQRLLAEGVAG